MDEEFELLEKNLLWDNTFNSLNNKSSDLNFSKEASSSENYFLNRYVNVLPFEHSRIKLSRGKTNYINANLVNVEEANRKYIFTQGPLKNTVDHFWLMVLEQNSKSIIMLTNLIENNNEKCFKYWPTKSKMLIKDFNISVELISKKKTKNFVIRKFCLKDLTNNFEHEVYQFHFIAWPDFNIPETPHNFLEFLYCIKDHKVLDNTDQSPAIVHCSAGMGRSGTFCAIDSLLIIIEKNKNLNVDVNKLILEMRKYRYGLIQTPDQLKYVYLVVLEGSKKILNDSKDENLKEPKLLETSSNEDDSLVNKNSYEIRKRLRENRNKQTMENINSIKKKKKELEEKSKFKEKLVKIGYFLFGSILFVGLSIYYSKLS